MAQLIITAVGADRPGLVGELTGHLHSAGANILDSRMVNLRGQFALLLLLDASTDATEQLRRSLPDAGAKLGLNVVVCPQQPSLPPKPGVTYRLKSYSSDQPGIVHRISALLQKHGVNIEELEARQESAAFAGSPVFIMEMRLTVPPAVHVRTLRRELESLGDQINCDIDLEGVE